MKQSHRSAVILGWCLGLGVAAALDHEWVLLAVYAGSALMCALGLRWSLRGERFMEKRR